MSYFLRHDHNNIWHGKFSIFPEEHVIHAISTRQGGKSQAPYNSLNLGLHVGDTTENVLTNRRIFALSLGLDARHIVTPQQVHGSKVIRVAEKERGLGSQNYAFALPDTDGLITDTPGLPLMLCFADCTPLLFFDPDNLAIGIAHAGWKGTVAHIGAVTVKAMAAEFGSQPEHILAAVGPAIGACCYEVGDNVIAAAQESFPDVADKLLIRREGKTYFDLWGANRQSLLEAGVSADNIETADTCTACEHQWYFSYRADGGTTGRIAALMELRPR